MAATVSYNNHSLVGEALKLLAAGLGPYVTGQLQDAVANGRYALSDADAVSEIAGDVAVMLRVMVMAWNDVFRDCLGQTERSLVSEIREIRNQWAHLESFNDDDLDRALDSVGRLLTAVAAADEAERVNRAKHRLRRKRYGAPPPKAASTDTAPAPVSEPPGTAPAPVSEPPGTAPAPVSEPPGTAPAPVSEPPGTAPAPVSEPPGTAPAPVSEPPGTVAAPAVALPEAAPTVAGGGGLHDDEVPQPAAVHHGADQAPLAHHNVAVDVVDVEDVEAVDVADDEVAVDVADDEVAVDVAVDDVADDEVNDYIHRGVDHRRQGDFGRAIAEFDLAIGISPANADAWYHRALAWGHMGDHDRAVIDFSRAIALNPEYADAYNCRGYARFCLGEYGPALDDFERAIGLNPDDALTQQNLELARRRWEGRTDDDTRQAPRFTDLSSPASGHR